MIRISRSLAISALCVSLLGCDELFPPIQSGEVAYWQHGQPQGTARTLTPEQAAALSAWLNNHRTGWESVKATYAPAILILAVHVDGTKSSVNLRPEVLIVGQRQRVISEVENKELLAIIGSF